MNYRRNYEDVQAFLDYLTRVRQLDDATIKNVRAKLDHLLIWAGSMPLHKANGIKQPLPAYLEKLKTSRDKLISASGLGGTLATIRMFFEWMKRDAPGRYRTIDGEWIDSLRPSRARRMESELVKRDIYSLEDVRKMMATQAVNLAERRTRAAAAFLFLSGMRIGAFVTLPVGAVDLEKRKVMQLPSMGVRTKNHKAAITYLLNIPDLLEICREWDREVRASGGYWYGMLNWMGNTFVFKERVSRSTGRTDFCGYLKALCDRAGIRYLSPHKLRHGHAVHALKQAKDMKTLKAISENLMHSSIGITDGVYGRLVEEDRGELIGGLGE